MSSYLPGAGAPLVGPWISRIGHVVDILATPCAVNPGVFVLAFWHSAPVLLASLYKPTAEDYLTERMGRPHKKGRRRGFHPDIAIDANPGTVKNALGWASFSATKLAERAGWYLLVADASTQFVVNWTSLAYQWSGCRTPGHPFCQSVVNSAVAFPFSAGTFVFSDWEVQAQQGFFGDVDSIGTPPGFSSNVIVSFLVKPANVPPLPEAQVTNVQIVDAINDTLLFEGAPQEYAVGEKSVITLQRDFLQLEQAHDYKVLITKTEGHYSAQGSSFQVYGMSDRGLFPDP